MNSVSCDIIIPYHTPTIQWLPTTMDSVLNQQHADCVIHLVADAVDPKEDAHIIEEYGSIPNVRTYRNSENIGPYQSVHKVYPYLETDFIAIQDSDDIALPHRIWHSITCLEEHNADIFGGAMENFIDWRSMSDQNENFTRYLDNQGIIMESGEKKDYAPSGRILNPTMVVRKKTFEKLNGFTDWFCGCDIEFTERAQRSGIAIHASPTVVVLRRLHSNSLVMGETYSYFSQKRTAIREVYIERLKEFDKGAFDPRAYGSLNQSLKTAGGLVPKYR